MVRPTSFGFDEQTAVSNSFQNKVDLDQQELVKRAGAEFKRLADTLATHGVTVVIFEDEPLPPKPNAVFPNNWLSTWRDGRVYLYPMATKSRRLERSPRLLVSLAEQFDVKHVIDLTGNENHEAFLESTGVMVFDHANKIVYGCVSVRCDETLFRKHAAELGYEPILVHAYDHEGGLVYHANLLMGVQTATAVVCLEAIADRDERAYIRERLEQTGHEVVAITMDQMNAYCGNVLEVQNAAGERFLVLSQGAYNAFTPAQRAVLSKDKTLLPVDVPTIETVGGGSVRCMLAELFLQPKAANLATRTDMQIAAAA
jgi:hypothetical protein